MMSRLCAIILAYNEAAQIVGCIESVHFADKVLVFDSFSSDQTVTLAQAAGAEVIQRKFENYADQRNAALQSAADEADWVLFVDADERVSPELAAEICFVIGLPDYAGWRLPRHNTIFGKLTLGAGWYPDYQTRLLRVGAAHYDPERKVHEVVILDGQLGTMQAHLTHDNYRDLAHFVGKQRKYTAYEASVLFEQGIRPKPQNYILQPIRHFLWRFLTLKGYRDGFHGLRLSGLMAWYEFRKYWILRGLWRSNA
ncbi:MAG: glycosyltransferase family 2 protein [Chitinophagaceae bacterium]|nr:glycosyltransferase family 2 protein [Anaerolineae bacterium]